MQFKDMLKESLLKFPCKWGRQGSSTVPFSLWSFKVNTDSNQGTKNYGYPVSYLVLPVGL